MKQSFKGGYILVSLGLIELSTEYNGSIDYDRISRTKKHIVLTGIKVDGKIMPDVCVKPQYGVGTVFFENVYGFDIGVHTDNSVDVNVHEEAPNVEEAESGTPVSMLGLDADGKVVKSGLPSGGTKLYKHSCNFSAGSPKIIEIISTVEIPFTESGVVPVVLIASSNSRLVYYKGALTFNLISVNESENTFTSDIVDGTMLVTDAVTEL